MHSIGVLVAIGDRPQGRLTAVYIKSQKHEGWEALPDRYDDGGYSGGTLERPALDELLTHIKQKKIDVVVVYKIDRLTRSLFDFSKIVEIFDAGGVSFVSITQQFNTTTSMGRLILNVLLSFAQFEREVTGERIRDKIAASKKKGMWMGGVVPFGYRVEKRELLVHEEEVRHVRRIYDLYLELGTVRSVKVSVDQLGITSRPTSRTPGVLLGHGHIYRILTNPIYMGKISHKGILSDGQHQAIIAPAVWQEVQRRLEANNAREREQPNGAAPSPLAGIIFDHKDERLTPSHAVKSGKRYRYYISHALVTDKAGPDGIRLSAPEVETAVAAAVRNLLTDSVKLQQFTGFHTASPSELRHLILAARNLEANLKRRPASDQLTVLRPIVVKVVIGVSDLTIDIKPQRLLKLLERPVEVTDALEEVAATPPPDHSINVPMRLGRRGNETRLILQSGVQQRPVDQKLINLIARGFVWREQIVSGAAESASSIADRDGISRPYVSRLIDLSFLAPDIIAAIANGTAPADLSAERLQSVTLPPTGSAREPSWASGGSLA